MVACRCEVARWGRRPSDVLEWRRGKQLNAVGAVVIAGNGTVWRTLTGWRPLPGRRYDAIIVDLSCGHTLYIHPDIRRLPRVLADHEAWLLIAPILASRAVDAVKAMGIGGTQVRCPLCVARRQHSRLAAPGIQPGLFEEDEP